MSPLLLALIAVGVVVALLVIIGFIAALYRSVVPTNMVHIVNSSSGRRVYGKDSEHGNTYYAFPSWIPKIGVSVTEFPISNFGVELKQYAAYDHKRLPFSVDIQAFFVMEDADIVSQRVSDFPELNQQLLKVVSGAVRKVCSSRSLEEILSSRSVLAGDFALEVVDQLKAWGVKPVNSIEFMNIQDSEGSKVIRDIQKKEESRIDRDSRVAQAENAQQAETKEIETQRQIELQRQEAEQQIGTRTAAKDQAIGIAEEQSKQAVAEQAKITTERAMEVKQVEDTRNAEIAKSVQVTQAEAKKETEVINAQAAKEQQVLAAQAQLEKDQRQADGNLALQTASAEGIAKVGKATADAEQQMQLASVTAQTTLAKEIGGNQDYQNYLINIKQIEVNGEVGKANAVALEKADIQIIAGPGADLGKTLSGVVTGLATTPMGQAVMHKLTDATAKA